MAPARLAEGKRPDARRTARDARPAGRLPETHRTYPGAAAQRITAVLPDQAAPADWSGPSDTWRHHRQDFRFNGPGAVEVFKRLMDFAALNMDDYATGLSRPTTVSIGRH